MFLPVLSYRSGRVRAERRIPRPGPDSLLRSKERMAPPVIAPKAGEFNPRSLTGFACPDSRATQGSSFIL